MQYGFFHIPERMIEFIAHSVGEEPKLSVSPREEGLRYASIEGVPGKFPFAAEIFPWLRSERNPVIFFTVLRMTSDCNRVQSPLPRMSQMWYNNGLVGMGLLGSCQPAVGIDPDTGREIFLHHTDYWIEMGMHFHVPSYVSTLIEMYIDHLLEYVYEKSTSKDPVRDKRYRENPHRILSQKITSNFRKSIALCVRYLHSSKFFDLFENITWRGFPRNLSRIFVVEARSPREAMSALPSILPGADRKSHETYCCFVCGTKRDNLHRWFVDGETLDPSELSKDSERVELKKNDEYEVCLKCIISSMIIKEWIQPSLFDLLYNHLFPDGGALLFEK